MLRAEGSERSARLVSSPRFGCGWSQLEFSPDSGRDQRVPADHHHDEDQEDAHERPAGHACDGVLFLWPAKAGISFDSIPRPFGGLLFFVSALGALRLRP